MLTRPAATSRRCAVLGHPIAHSLSPVLHRAAYAELELDWSFEAIDVDEAGLEGFVSRAEHEPGPPWRGLALTMPLKRVVLGLLDDVDELVRTVGAANTLLWEPDGSRRGANTDVPGMLGALGARGAGSGPATVLGGGATAAAAVAALASTGRSAVSVRVRDPGRVVGVRQVAERVGVALRVDRFDARWDEPSGVLVSTVPSAAALEAVAAPGWGRVARPGAVVLDAVYDPWPSVLLVAALHYGARTVSGIDLLAHQALAQVRAMCGREVPLETLSGAAAAALRDRGQTPAGYAQ